ncbi:hypothetical protein LOAG_04215 [Loa loa]|uniref:Uncharacterized protein n=1 Tax=Loa loa TaxID=7209 RepID=A0A1S0U4I7_LOALO|nr:hypothetical protein LOAG_04215 [Loa loa]EFO24273.1 hypothetical protein LOAG_04215 [Loa loa]
MIWKAYEGQELTSCTSSDDNILQIFLSNSNRAEVIVDVRDLIESTHIAVDHPPDKHSFFSIDEQESAINSFEP